MHHLSPKQLCLKCISNSCNVSNCHHCWNYVWIEGLCLWLVVLSFTGTEKKMNLFLSVICIEAKYSLFNPRNTFKLSRSFFFLFTTTFSHRLSPAYNKFRTWFPQLVYISFLMGIYCSEPLGMPQPSVHWLVSRTFAEDNLSLWRDPRYRTVVKCNIEQKYKVVLAWLPLWDTWDWKVKC